MIIGRRRNSVLALLALIGALPGIARAAPVATGPNSWRDSETGKVQRAVGPGTPVNYQSEDGTWDRIDPSWRMASPSTWEVTRGKHKVEADASGGARFAVSSGTRRHVLGTHTTQLVLVDMTDTSWSHLDWLDGRGGSVRGNRITYKNIIPGLDKVLIYEPDAYREHFVIGRNVLRDDRSIGRDNLMLGTVTLLELDSLGLQLMADGNEISFSGRGTVVSGWASAYLADSAIWHIAEAFLQCDDTVTDIRVWKWFTTVDSVPSLIEMFSLSQASALNAPVVEHDAYFGSKTAATSNLSIENQIAGSPFTCPTPGYGDSITAYLNITGASGSPKVSSALYTVGASSGSFLDSTYSRAIPVDKDAGAAWESMALVSRPYLNASTRYFVLAWSENGSWGVNLRVQSGSSGDTTSVDLSQTYGAWPGTFARDVNLANYVSSIYLTYTEDWPRRRTLLLGGGN